MTKEKQYLIASIIGTLVFATILAYAGSYNTARIGSMPVFVLVVIVSFTINCLAYIPAILAQTEHYYDLTGAATYLSVIIIALIFSPNLDARAYLVAAMVCVWALRLGLYLFRRVKRNGADGRFANMKSKPINFLVAWTTQALWVVVTAACALAIITSNHRIPFSWVGYTGVAVWLFGFSIETIADYQKSLFKQDSANKEQFISSGLWAWSQHPNYFGEITLWCGIAIMAIPILSGGLWFCMISPVFVFVLLRYISGVNLSHEIGLKRWGDDPAYLLYKKNTPILILKSPSKHK